jgi:hypothetical protein
MGCGMTVPNAVPPSERPSVENHPVVPWNVPPVPVAAKRTKHAANPQCSIGTTTGRNASCFALNFVPFRSTCPPREWNGGTVSRARILTKAATAGRSFPATRRRAARERRAGERQQKRASKHLFGGLGALTVAQPMPLLFLVQSTLQRPRACLIQTLVWERKPRPSSLRPWLFPVALERAIDAIGAKRSVINALPYIVWRSGVLSSLVQRDLWCLLRRRPGAPFAGHGGWGEKIASSRLSGVTPLSRRFFKKLVVL